MNRDHLNALELRLSHERARLMADKSPLRAVWIAQIEREIANEKVRIGICDDFDDLDDDELLAALQS